MPIKISYVSSKSLFRQMSVRKGDLIVSINGRNVYDSYGVIAEASKRSMDFRIRRRNGTEFRFRVGREDYSKIMMEFEEEPLKRCANRCMFCFIDQNPPGLRDSLYIKDDDYRYSLEYGSFITLSNLTEEYINNIIDHSLSPLYISVHSSEEIVRKRMFGRENNLKRLERLISAGIKIHAQIVLVRGVNDGVHLLRTLEYAMENGFLTTGIVPCGLTGYRKGLSKILPMDSDYMKKIINSVEKWKTERSFRRVYLADEFFLKTSNRVPEKEYYGGFEQIENGIGMVRDFEENTSFLKGKELKSGYAVLTAGLFGRYILDRGLFRKGQVHIAKNRFMGGNVETAGLLSGSDVIHACSKIPQREILLTSAMFNDDGLTVDEMDKGMIESESGKCIHVIKEYNSIRKYLCR